jgi:hypothetical protein
MRKLSIFLAFILVLVSAQAFAQCSVTISNVAGSWNDGGTVKLQPGVVSTFQFNFNSTCDVPGFGFNVVAAFVLTSPDGGNWGYASAKTYAGWTACNWTSFFLNHFNKTGGTGAWGAVQSIGAGNVGGNDSVAVLFAGASFSSANGLRGGFNGLFSGIEFQPAAVEGKTICIDTCFPPGGQWGWSSITLGHPNIKPAWYTAPQCYPVQTPPNFPPAIAMPAITPISHCVVATINFTANEAENDVPYTWEVVSGAPGSTIVSTGPKTATWSWSDAPQQGAITLKVRAKDTFGVNHWGDTLTVELMFTNNGPVITCPTAVPTIQADQCKDVTVTATDDCDPLVWTVVDQGGMNGTVTNTDGVFHVCPLAPAGVYTITVQVTDGLVPVQCSFNVNVIETAPYGVRIEKLHKQIQGQFADVDLTLLGVDPAEGFGGFDLLVAYDNSALSLQLAQEGSIYDLCNWEYFTFRFGANGNCGNACPSGLVRVIGIAETNNGAHHPIEGCPTDARVKDTLQEPVTLASLRFLVSNNRTFECQYIPVRFFWVDCGDNVLSNESGDVLFISAKVFDYDNAVPINNGLSGFPTYLGAQDDCLTHALPNKPLPLRYVDFYNGGVDIACADSIDARGDLNLNGLAYEIADAVMFTNYFIEGLSAFGAYPDGATAASDANADGLPLTVGDLVYLIRVIIGDALPYPKLAPLATSYSIENGKVSIDAEMGAAYLVFEGSVTPTLLANNMKMKVGELNGQTRVLVYSDEANQTFNGAFLQVNGTLVSSEFATYEGQPVAAKNVPKNFAVQNYPNPFNPTTTFELALPQGGDWSVNVYNVTGQLVWSQAGTSEPGIKTVEWNASNCASGVYFYKVAAGTSSITKKAVLLK